eukprot:1213955-Karenia_brevis.AAC.1
MSSIAEPDESQIIDDELDATFRALGDTDPSAEWPAELHDDPNLVKDVIVSGVQPASKEQLATMTPGVMPYDAYAEITNRIKQAA